MFRSDPALTEESITANSVTKSHYSPISAGLQYLVNFTPVTRGRAALLSVPYASSRGFSRGQDPGMPSLPEGLLQG